MKIESYEPYHIGTKLHPYINLEVFKEKARKELEKRGYELPKEVLTEPIKIGPTREVLATREDTKVELNVPAKALNVIGTSPKNVMRIFKELMAVFPTLGFELDSAIVFHEILATINIKTEENPLKILKKISKIKFELLRHIGNLGLTALRISNVKEEKEGEIVNIIIEPNPASPNTRFLITFMFRSRNKDRIEAFHKRFERRIMDVMSQLRGK